MKRRDFFKTSLIFVPQLVASDAKSLDISSSPIKDRGKLPRHKGGICVKCGNNVDYYETHLQNRKNPKLVLHLDCGSKVGINFKSPQWYFRFDG